MAEAIADTRELLERLELVDVGCYELHGFRGALIEDKGREILGPGAITDWELEEQQHRLEVLWRDGGGSFLVRLQAHLRGNAGELSVGVQGEWDTGELAQEDVAPATEEDFINRVAVFALVPYLRSAISDAASRILGINVTMGLVRPGDLEFSTSRVLEASASADSSQ